MNKRASLLFLLPNLFTVSSIFCGLYAIVQATNAANSNRFYHAAIAILFAVIFDSVDGRVARMTRTQTEFGVQLDSLADLVSFGLAPSVLVYEWALSQLGLIGIFIAFAFTACGALRLARFNVMANRAKKASDYFSGLPIPLAAVCIVSLVLLHHRTTSSDLWTQPKIISVMVILSVLMVSHIRYRTFKQIKANRLSLSFAIGFAVLTLIVAWKTSFSLVFMIGSSALIILGPAEEIVRLVRRKIPGQSDKELDEEHEEIV